MTSWPFSAAARAIASPTTPAPTTRTCMEVAKFRGHKDGLPNDAKLFLSTGRGEHRTHEIAVQQHLARQNCDVVERTAKDQSALDQRRDHVGGARQDPPHGAADNAWRSGRDAHESVSARPTCPP